MKYITIAIALFLFTSYSNSAESESKNFHENIKTPVGPSDSYGGRVRARIKPNITFAEDIEGNPAAEVEVRCAPDGTIVSRKLTKSSGNASWDAAVLKSIDKTEVLPRDVDGRVPSPIIINFFQRMIYIPTQINLGLNIKNF